MRWLLTLLGAGAAWIVAGCVPWPLGPRLDVDTSGLVGEWAAAPTRASTDTVIWRFRDDGSYETWRAGPDAAMDERGVMVPIGRGRWDVYRDAQGDPRPLVCFNHRATRWPSCRHFAVDTVIDTTGHAGRVLTWQGWVSRGKQTTAVLTERES